MNILGLSTQLSIEYVYISDGPTRKYDYCGTPIYFKHVSQKEVKDISLEAALIIQALRILGKQYIYNQADKEHSDE